MPSRIQRQRTKGWRMPEGAVYVGRPTVWGNPFVYRHRTRGLVRYGPKHLERFGRFWDYEGRIYRRRAQRDPVYKGKPVQRAPIQQVNPVVCADERCGHARLLHLTTGFCGATQPTGVRCPCNQYQGADDDTAC